MTVRIEEAAVLPAAPEAVWPVLVDWEGQASWMPDVASVRVHGVDRELGARVGVRTRVFGLPLVTDVLVVTAWEPPRRIAVRHTGLVKGTGEWLLEPVDAGTRFTWADELQLPAGRVGDLAFRAYAPWQRAMIRRSLRNLAGLLRGRSWGPDTHRT